MPVLQPSVCCSESPTFRLLGIFTVGNPSSWMCYTHKSKKHLELNNMQNKQTNRDPTQIPSRIQIYTRLLDSIPTFIAATWLITDISNSDQKKKKKIENFILLKTAKTKQCRGLFGSGTGCHFTAFSPAGADFNICQLIMMRIINSCCVLSNTKIMSHSFKLCRLQRRRIRCRQRVGKGVVNKKSSRILKDYEIPSFQTRTTKYKIHFGCLSGPL